MTPRLRKLIAPVLAAFASTAVAAACRRGDAAADGGAPPPAVVVHEVDGSLLSVDHPERFALVTASERDAAPTLSVTGVVSPDPSRAIPVVSLASGRVVDLRVRLGDHVEKGQLLLRVRSADVTLAFADYRKARADQLLARAQLERARTLASHGAIAGKDLEVAQDASEKTDVDLSAAADRLELLGVDPARAPSDVVDIIAPASGFITEQNVTAAAGVKTLDNSPNLLTISDLSRVWIVCDVYEDDLPTVHVGDRAEIHAEAYPEHPLEGRVDNIAPVLDPALRTAKVRIDVANPGMLRLGMFVTATVQGHAVERQAVVPATAVLHLHDRDWVYVPAGHGYFRRVEVVGGTMLPGGAQELRSGLLPGQRVVADALVFQSTVDQ